MGEARKRRGETPRSASQDRNSFASIAAAATVANISCSAEPRTGRAAKKEDANCRHRGGRKTHGRHIDGRRGRTLGRARRWLVSLATVIFIITPRPDAKRDGIMRDRVASTNDPVALQSAEDARTAEKCRSDGNTCSGWSGARRTSYFQDADQISLVSSSLGMGPKESKYSNDRRLVGKNCSFRH